MNITGSDIMVSSTQANLEQAIREKALLVCIDVEAHCHNTSIKERKAGMRTNKRRICEIGIDFMDTTEIKEDDMGDRATNLLKYHHPYELAIQDARHDPSTAKCHPAGFCRVGIPENFLFGHPKYIFKHEIKDVVLGLIRSYAGSMDRKIIFLFFAQANDMMWLSENGVELQQAFPNSEIIDIQRCRSAVTLAKIYHKQHLGARDLYPAIGIPTENKHNGGNDAAFELQAWLAESSMNESDFLTLANGGHLQPMMPKMWEALAQDQIAAGQVQNKQKQTTKKKQKWTNANHLLRY